MLYAIVESGGKQYKAVEGSHIEVDLLPEEVGKKKTFEKVLLLVDDGKTQVGTPYLAGISVDTTVVEHFKGPKLIIFKYRAKERYRRKTGHRQKYTRLLIDSIAFPGKVAKPAVKAEEPAEKKVEAAKKPAAKSAAAAKKQADTKKPAAAKKPAATKKPAAKK